MARITVEDCLERVENRFELVHLAIKRVKELKRNAPPLVECDNREVVTALREIAAGKVYPIHPGEALEQGDQEKLTAPEERIPEQKELESKDSSTEAVNE